MFMSSSLNDCNLIFGTFQYKDQIALQEIMELSLDNGICCFDTSPSYNTQEMLGTSMQAIMAKGKYSRDDIIVQDKIDAWQMYKSKGDIVLYVKESLRKLKIDYLDVLLIHWPFPFYLKETWMNMQRLKMEGLVHKIGLCNVRKRNLERIMNDTGIRPDVIQIERHPLRICSEDMVYFKQQGFYVEAYSPLCRMDRRLRESAILNAIAKNKKKTVGQVVLRWHIQTGSTPIFMTTKKNRLVENSSIFDFELSSREIHEIDSLNEDFKLFVESICCPGI